MTATVPTMPRARGDLTPEQRREIGNADATMQAAEQDYQHLIVSALRDGASFRAVAELTGLSTNTLQRWKRETR